MQIDLHNEILLSVAPATTFLGVLLSGVVLYGSQENQ